MLIVEERRRATEERLGPKACSSNLSEVHGLGERFENHLFKVTFDHLYQVVHKLKRNKLVSICFNNS